MPPPSSTRSSRSRWDKETLWRTPSLRGSRSRRDMAVPPSPRPRSSADRGRCRSMRRLCRSGTCRPRSFWGWPIQSDSIGPPGKYFENEIPTVRRGEGGYSWGQVNVSTFVGHWVCIARRHYLMCVCLKRFFRGKVSYPCRPSVGRP